MQANGILGQGSTLAGHENRAFRVETHCKAGEEAEEIWMQIGNTGEVAFDAVVAVSEQIVDLWSKSHACKTCQTRVHEQFLSIYIKLIDLLEGAITAYTSSLQPLSSAHSTSLISDSRAWRRAPSQAQNDRQESIMSGTFMSPPTPSILCQPSAMSLGEYELNEQQSRHLALELVGRKLKSLATILRQILDQEDDVSETRTKAGAALLRVLRLLSTVHRWLVLVQASSVRKANDIALDSVDVDDYKGC